MVFKYLYMNNKRKESTAILIQIIASIISIGTVITSIILLYNLRLQIDGKEPFIQADEAQKITTINQSIILLVFITFLLANYVLYNISKDEGEDLTVYTLQIIASCLSVTSAIIGLYIVLRKRMGDLITDVENPII